MVVPDSISLIIRPKYPRPPRLSDPWGDFTPEELEAIIRKRDADLTDMDLRNIFQSILPAGEYHECVYFLPLALERIVKPAGDSDLACDVLSWIGDSAEELKADGLWDELLTFIEDFFAELTSSFVLRAEGYPENCAMIDNMIEELNCDRNGFGNLGDRLMRKHLGAADTYPRAAWLVYLAECQHYYGIWQSEYLRSIAEDRSLLKKAYDTIVSNVVEDDRLLDYWSSKFDRIGLW